MRKPDKASRNALLMMARIAEKGGAKPDTGAAIRAMAPLAERFGADKARDAMVSALATIAANLRTVDGGRQLDLTAELFTEAATAMRALAADTRAGREPTPSGPLSILSVPLAAVIGEPEGRA